MALPVLPPEHSPMRDLEDLGRLFLGEPREMPESLELLSAHVPDVNRMLPCKQVMRDTSTTRHWKDGRIPQKVDRLETGLICYD